MPGKSTALKNLRVKVYIDESTFVDGTFSSTKVSCKARSSTTVKFTFTGGQIKGPTTIDLTKLSPDDIGWGYEGSLVYRG